MEKKAGNTLLEKALKTPYSKSGNVPTKDETELAIAFLNGTISARQYYSAKGCSASSAAANAFYILKRANKAMMIEITAATNII